MTESTGVERFGLAARLLHWLMTVSIITMLVLGALLVGSLGDYPMVLAWHKAVGVVVLVLAVLRVGNRIWHKPPPLSLAQPERFIAAGSELAMYTLFLAQPVIGWALVSASGVPVTIAGLHFSVDRADQHRVVRRAARSTRVGGVRVARLHSCPRQRGAVSHDRVAGRITLQNASAPLAAKIGGAAFIGGFQPLSFRGARNGSP